MGTGRSWKEMGAMQCKLRDTSAGGGHQEARTSTEGPRLGASKEARPCQYRGLRVQPPELWENPLLLFRTASFQRPPDTRTHVLPHTLERGGRPPFVWPGPLSSLCPPENKVTRYTRVTLYRGRGISDPPRGSSRPRGSSFAQPISRMWRPRTREIVWIAL